jgi:hypothetical protein
VQGVECAPRLVGIGLSHLKILRRDDIEPPFIVFEDDCEFTRDFQHVHRLPDSVDALYLGVSHFGLAVPGEFGWGQWEGTVSEQYSENYLRVFNMLGRHGIVYLSEKFRRGALEAALDALANPEHVYPGDIGYAMLQANHLVLTPNLPSCFQSPDLGGNRSATRAPLRTRADSFSIHRPNDMKIAHRRNDEFHLFLDLFPHWSGAKLTAVAAHYGDDLDWAQLGIDLDDIRLVVGEIMVTGACIRHRLDSFEPGILIDFEHDDLERLLSGNRTIEASVFAGSTHRTFTLDCRPPKRHDVSLGLIVRDGNRWLPYYLDYYLDVLKAGHIYLYDNNTRDRGALMRMIRPYLDREQVTYIPWHYRWKNHGDRKQIGQPPQQMHCLNKYGRDTWIGFFDIDEFLRIPGEALPGFLARYDPAKVGALSFDLKWFMYQGDLKYEEIQNPLLSFFHSKRDRLGRKRQKLIVSPRNVRFVRIHWIQDDQEEVPVTEDDVFFHHYCLSESRFEQGKTETDVEVDEYMTGFSDASSPQAVSEHGSAAIPSGVEAWKRHIEHSFDQAERESSKLEPDVLGISGFCGVFTRHFYNNLCAYPGCRYLEIGSWKGASVCAAAYRNDIEAVCIDNWSRFAEQGHPKPDFDRNVSRYCDGSKVRLVESDCFNVDMNGIGPFDVFLYDGDHSEQSHCRAIKHFYPCLSNLAVMIIDDWNWKRVRNGTLKALNELPVIIRMQKQVVMSSEDISELPYRMPRFGWWNGLGIFLVEKTR